MSAYVVENHVIDYVLSAYYEFCRDGGSLFLYLNKRGENVRSIEIPFMAEDEPLSEIGSFILAENVKSVSYRYNDNVNDVEPEYVFRKHRGVFEADGQKVRVQAIKAIECIEYQSCEHPEWFGSDAQVALNQMARQLMKGLRGYSAAEWGAPEHPADGEGSFSICDMMKRA